MLGFFRRLTQRGADASIEDDPEIVQEMDEGLEAVRRAEAAGSLPVLDTQHRAIGSDACHLAVPVSRPDEADAFGKLFITNRRVIFSGPSPVSLGLGHIIKADRQQRDVVIVSGSAGLLRFRCNSFGDAMMAAWLLDKLRKA